MKAESSVLEHPYAGAQCLRHLVSRKNEQWSSARRTPMVFRLKARRAKLESECREPAAV